VITVCDGAKEACPVFTGRVKNRLHIGFEDPAKTRGTEEEVIPVYRKVRDEIAFEFKRFYENTLKP
jgi:arsenate reductase